MMETSPLSWALVCFLALLNYLRINLHYNCQDHEVEEADDDHEAAHRALGGDGDDGAELHVSEHCADFTTVYFIACGLLLLGFGLVVSWLTWRSKVLLMEVKSLYNVRNIAVLFILSCSLFLPHVFSPLTFQLLLSVLFPLTYRYCN